MIFSNANIMISSLQISNSHSGLQTDSLSFLQSGFVSLFSSPSPALLNFVSFSLSFCQPLFHSSSPCISFLTILLLITFLSFPLLLFNPLSLLRSSPSLSFIFFFNLTFFPIPHVFMADFLLLVVLFFTSSSHVHSSPPAYL